MRENIAALYKGSRDIDIELRKKSEWLSHIARSSEPLPSRGWHSTLKYTFFLVSGHQVWLKRRVFTRNRVGHPRDTRSQYTNKKALERTKTSQCRRLLWWSSAGHPGASSLVAAGYGISEWRSQTRDSVQHWKTSRKICRYCLVNRADTLDGYWGHSTLQTK